VGGTEPPRDAIVVEGRAPSRRSIARAAIATAWLCILGVSLLVLWTETELRPGLGCQVPGTDSSYGVVQWQWLPPGTHCSLYPNVDYPEGTPRTWGGPSNWRWSVVAALVGLPVVFAVTFIRGRQAAVDGERSDDRRGVPRRAGTPSG
jgi:hypothetical protein